MIEYSYIKRHKARLAFKGFLQLKGADDVHISAPVILYTTLRVLLALVVQRLLKMLQVDVKCALPNRNL